MASKQPNKRGMTNFVHGKEQTERHGGAGGGNPSFDDLKYGAPSTMQVANTAQQRSYQPAGAPHSAAHRRTLVKQEPNTQGTMFGADLSSMGEHSDVPSDLPQGQAARSRPTHLKFRHSDQVQQRGPSIGYPANDSDIESEPDFKGNSEAFGNLPEPPSSSELPDHLLGAMNEMDALRVAGVLPMGYAKGDSYPSTTSGPPSVYEPPDRNDAAANSGLPITEIALPARQAQKPAASAPRPKQSNAQAALQTNHAEDFEARAAPLGSKIRRPDDATQDATVAPFSFAPVQSGPRVNAPAPLANQQTREVAASRSRESIDTAHAQQASTTESGRATSQNGQPTVTAPEQPMFYSPAQAHMSGKAMHYTNMKSIGDVPPADQVPPLAQPETSVNALNDKASKGSAAAEEELKLDYSKDKLFSMDYAELKSQSFDHTPQEQPASPSSDNERSMEDRMKDASGLNSQKQHDFFASLPIDEWEQAGDWFLGQFGGVLTKLKSLRREKREATLGFERRIEGRHLAVEKKRKLTKDALDAMRTSGEQVLDGTPKKARKST